jgi:hypothetical protein
MARGPAQAPEKEVFAPERIIDLVTRLIESGPTSRPLTSSAVRQEKDIARFALLAEGPPPIPRTWRSKHVFVCSLTVTRFPFPQHRIPLTI